MTLRLNLGQYLQRHQITAYRLVGEVRGKVAPNTIYALARKPAQRIDLNTVSEVLRALERLTGEKVIITEVLEEAQETSAPASPDHAAHHAPARKFQYGGYRIKIAPGPSAEDIVAELRGR